MSDVGQYGHLQNASDQGVTANALVGEHAGNVTAHQIDDARFSRASFSTAPHKSSRVGCVGKDNTCRVAPMKGTNRCYFHTPTEDLP